MDRRKFLTGVGVAGAVATSGWAAVQSSAAETRARALAEAAGASRSGSGLLAAGAAKGSRPEGLAVGYLPRDAGKAWTWKRWEGPTALFGSAGAMGVSIGSLQRAKSPIAVETLQDVRITAHFAIDDSPHVAPFYAWGHGPAGFSKQAASFNAHMPDRVALQVDYELNAATVANGILTRGSLFLPLGGRDGLDTGLHVLAGPALSSGMHPDFRDYAFRADLDSPLVHRSGSEPDFDFVVVAIDRLEA